MHEREVYENLPNDPEEAFLKLESLFREECEVAIANAHDNERTDVYHVRYIARVLGAITALELESQFSSEVPQIEDVDYNTYLNFSKDVENYRTVLSIRRGRRVQGYSVHFNEATKEKLRHHLRQMRDVVDKCEVEQPKKEALFSKINALEIEVDRDRTRLDALADLTVTAAGILDTALEPVNKLLNTVARVFYGAQREEPKRIPPPAPRRRIEGPKISTSTRKPSDMDDEMPF